MSKKPFNPVVYRNEMPKKFEERVEFLEAYNSSISFLENRVFFKENYKEKTMKTYSSKLERKILKDISSANMEGDLILIEEPNLSVLENYMFESRYNLSANFELYKITGSPKNR